MKLITKFSLIAAALAVFGAISARADDQQLANRLAIERAQASNATTTVAVFSGGQGLGGAAQTGAQEKQLAQRNDGHGHDTTLFR
jgi:hypothetical protein